jgi:hypothetical protein
MTNTMRRSPIASFTLIVLWVAPAGAQELPESAHVQATEALVRSGPSEAFYPTGRLEAGQRVEIYRRKEDGWCAIRPPDGSFSYVRADHVRPTESGAILEVTREGTRTRVGSMLKRAYQVEYVALKLGERLELLGGPVRLGTSRLAWYRVAPPAGEFRWVRARDLQSPENVAAMTTTTNESPSKKRSSPQAIGATSPEHETEGSAAEPLRPAPVDEDQRTNEPLRRQLAATAVSADDSAKPADDAKGLAFEKLAGTRSQMTTEPIRQTVMPASETVVRASRAEPARIADFLSDNVAEATGRASERMSNTGPIVSDPDLRLSELELALSQMVTQEVDRWELAPLRQHANRLLEEWFDEGGQRAARQLLERIDEFAVLQRRHRDLATLPADELARTVSLASAVAPRPAFTGLAAGVADLPPDPPNQFLARQAAIRRQAERVHYAGQGWLVPVLSSHPHLPRFALTDREGSIQAFVSPRPGLNLRRFMRREVGIVGRETSRLDEAAPHLLAERVVVLDRHR